MKLQMIKKIGVFIVVLLQFFSVNSQTTEFIGTMTTDDVQRSNIRVQVVENGSRVSGTIYSMRVAKHLSLTVDVNIDSLTLTKNGSKKIITGKNIVPQVNGKKIEKIKVNDFYGVIENNCLTFTTSFGKKTMKYKGFRHVAGSM